VSLAWKRRARHLLAQTYSRVNRPAQRDPNVRMVFAYCHAAATVTVGASLAHSGRADQAESLADIRKNV
jgi:hypothetical protein